MGKVKFLGDDGTFSIDKPENYNYLYFPIAGKMGIKNCVTPNLGGDSKLDQESFLLEPVSVENLHNNRSTRNLWCKVEGLGCWSVVGASAEEEAKKFTKEQDDSRVTAGLMWHMLERESKKYALKAEVTSFVPVNDNVEIMRVKVSNVGTEVRVVTPVVAIPIYGRSADNIRDHRNVTSMLHRIHTEEEGVVVKPTMSFDEKGHRRNHLSYFVAAVTGFGDKPAGFYPTVDAFVGEGGTFTHPRAIYSDMPRVGSGHKAEGKEAVGGIEFEKITLFPGQNSEYIVVMGITEEDKPLSQLIAEYNNSYKVDFCLERVKEYWQKTVNVKYHTGDKDFDTYMRWVSFQPFLRRLYGCSFLPHHDYGRGGRGWRDLWQDCLSLLLMDPGDVRNMIVANYGGVRIDGSNATIIGHKPGEFVADRNGISRVWMDHGVWPYITTKLYMDQTGDVEILGEKATYFKDPQAKRGTDIDTRWNADYGMQQKTLIDTVYEGTILEHLLVENLTAFYEVGDHNIMRLRGADWNDALDMADKNGESVAFTCAYAGNLRQLAESLLIYREKTGKEKVEVLEELKVLLRDDAELYNSVENKKAALDEYVSACIHHISGNKISISIEELATNLTNKSDWIMKHVRSQEWIEGKDNEGWFNSYYDNSKNAVEGYFPDGVRMMLTGQVFATMSGTATDEQVARICQSADKYLYEAPVGGYRLNTNFNELKFDMGRQFGFAYGEKENGAVFSHMTVMYANALYKRGFVKEGYKALQTLADKALDFETSKIYPGIPEYFNNEGRGLYHYLTGAASWYMMTVITEVFGVHGESGDLVITPKLLNKQFDEEGKAAIRLTFAGKELEVTIKNTSGKEYGEYKLGSADCDGEKLEIVDGIKAVMAKDAVRALMPAVHKLTVELV